MVAPPAAADVVQGDAGDAADRLTDVVGDVRGDNGVGQRGAAFGVAGGFDNVQASRRYRPGVQGAGQGGGVDEGPRPC